LKILKILSNYPRGAGATVNRGAGTGTIRLFSGGGVVLKLADESSAQSDPTVITIRDAYELIVNGYAEWLDPPPQVRAPGAHQRDRDHGKAGGRRRPRGANTLARRPVYPRYVIRSVHIAIKRLTTQKLFAPTAPA
jgi:hypothetical protein